MRILHIDTEKTWRGGENQTRLFIEGCNKKNITSFVAINPDSVGASKFASFTHVFPVKMRGGFNPIAAYKIAAFCKTNDIRIVACQTSNAHAIGLLIKKLHPKIRLIVHRRVDFALKSGLFNRRKYLSQNVDAYISVSNAVSKILIDYGIKKDKIFTIPDAVDPSPYNSINKSACKIKLCSQYQINPNIPIFGNASALTTQKGYEVLLPAIKHLKDKNLQFHCFIAGVGHLEQELKDLSKRLDIGSHVTFLGWVDDIVSFLGALDILTMPSNNEGMGSLIQDATYAGCAIVATDVGGIPEMIEHEKFGLLSNVGDSQQLSYNIERLITHLPLAQTFAEQAKINMLKNFSLQQMVEDTLKVYIT